MQAAQENYRKAKQHFDETDRRTKIALATIAPQYPIRQSMTEEEIEAAVQARIRVEAECGYGEARAALLASESALIAAAREKAESEANRLGLSPERKAKALSAFEAAKYYHLRLKLIDICLRM